MTLINCEIDLILTWPKLWNFWKKQSSNLFNNWYKTLCPHCNFFKNLPGKVEMKYYNVTIDGQNVFKQLVKSHLKRMITLKNLRQVKEVIIQYANLQAAWPSAVYILIGDLSKQHALEADSKATQQISFTENLERDGNKTIFFFIEEAK